SCLVTVKVKCPNCSLSDFPHRKNIVYRVNGLRQTSRRGLDSKYIMPPDSYHQLPSAFKKRMTNINRLHQCVQNVASNNIGAIQHITSKFTAFHGSFKELFQSKARILDPDSEIQLNYRLLKITGYAWGYASGKIPKISNFLKYSPRLCPQATPQGK
ncbi:hypothetical protein T03_12585, partial [Trichinella britovi]